MDFHGCRLSGLEGFSFIILGSGQGEGKWIWSVAASKQIGDVSDRNCHDRSTCSQIWGWEKNRELKKERDWGRDDGNTTALSPNAGFPAA